MAGNEKNRGSHPKKAKDRRQAAEKVPQVWRIPGKGAPWNKPLNVIGAKSEKDIAVCPRPKT